MRLAVIPARGGSKRIPRKNIRDFAGKPIIAYSIECAKQSGLFDQVIVSTDDEEIAGVARNFGAAVPFIRPSELADDFTDTTAVMAHAVDRIAQEQNVQLSAVCCIYPTAPFVSADDLQKGLAQLESGNWLYVFSAASFGSPIFRSFRKNANGGLKMFFPDQFSVRSQDLPEALHDCGQFYWGTPDAWLSKAKIFDGHSSIVTIPRWRVQDIDSEEDWTRAELIASSIKNSDHPSG